MRNDRVAEAVYTVVLLSLLAVSLMIPPLPCMANTYDSNPRDVKASAGSDNIVRPIIYHPDKIDKDFDAVQDSLEATISQLTANKSATLPIVVTLYNPVSSLDLDYFMMLGGRVTHVYRYVTYGFAGVIPAANISTFASLEKGNLCVIERDVPVLYCLDVSVPLIRARPTVWDTYGYSGSPNHSIAIIDTGIDDSHSDIGPYGDLNFSRKIVGWYDATPDMAATPEDYCEHGTHCAGIAAGTGTANGLQGSGNIETTFTLKLPPEAPGPRVYGYIDHIDVMNPGVVELNCSWDGGNNVWLILSDPGDNRVADTSGTSSPLILTHNTAGTSYPTGLYEVFVGNIQGPSGTPFSCAETYPYEGRNDGYNLFTGVAPDSKLVGVKVFDNTGFASSSMVYGGMDWVIANKDTYNITVASMSITLQNGGVDSTFDLKADTMVENGIVTCVAAGNYFPDYTIGSPGTAAYVITVGATNDQNGITSYSSNGQSSKNEYGLTKPDVAAPGGSGGVGSRIISVDSNDVDYEYSGQDDYTPSDYQQMSGTSMSTPHVAGLASLIVEALSGWNWTKDEALKVKMIVSMTAFEVQSGESTNVPPLNRGEKDDKEGYGRICADAAIEAVTITYELGKVASDTLGFGPSDKKVWARQVSLTGGTNYEFNLSVPSGADYDLYLYNGEPDSYGQPVILSKSVNAVSGAEEIIEYTPTESGTCYIVVKWVSGSGTFNLTSTTDHDVAVVSVEPSTARVYAGQTINITVVAENEGMNTETFNVTVKYENTTMGIVGTIGTQTVTNLASGTNTTLTFSWNTSVTACVNYTINAEASVVPGENDVSDNTFIDGTVWVKFPGDVTGDGVVDIWDLTTAAIAYACEVGEPYYNPDADMNSDGVVDIGDISVIGKNYGKTCK